MTILSKTIGSVGQVGVVPRRIQMVVTDSLSVVTTANYLQPDHLYPDTIQPTDILDMYYGATSLNSPGTYGEFLVSITAGVITLIENGGSSILPTVSNAFAIFSNTTGTLVDNVAGVNSVSTSSATPGTIRSIKGLMSGTNTTMTSGNLVGVRGEVDCVGASGGFLYGAQGKVIPTGTLSGSSWTAGVFGQFDLSAATINAGQIAGVWADMGASGGTFTDVTGARMFAGTNTISGLTLFAMDYRYGKATNLLELDGSSSTYISTGGATASGTIKKIAISIDGVQYYLQAATVYS